ncbi:MAG: twin-arginine translocase subunit TatB [Alphaproteobacteria bacterium]|nr:twin-arginine translocase subunit TatB [Alphaproteobacteria bacterium]
MFDIAPSELLLLAVVALIFIGPKDLPKVMRVVGRWIGKARAMASHFRSGIDEMIRQSELEELEKKWKAENERIMREHPLAAPFDPFDASPAAAHPPLADAVAEGVALAAPAQPMPVESPVPDPHAPGSDPEAPELPLPPGERAARDLP